MKLKFASALLLAVAASSAFAYGSKDVNAPLLPVGAGYAPVKLQTPNGDFNYYTNDPALKGKGTLETGCYIPYLYRGQNTVGFAPKLIQQGQATVFIDCVIPKPVVVVPVVVAPAPVVVAPAPVAPPTPVITPAPVRKKIRE